MSDAPETQKAVLESNGQWSFVLKECCERLEGERDEARAALEFRRELYKVQEKCLDEAREDLEEETKFHHRTHTELIQNQCKLLDMEMQRDEARDKVEQQRKEIVRLNGATNHAKGTPLKIALRERDDALSQIAQAENRAERFCQERDDAREALEFRREERDKIQTELEMWRDGNILHEIHRNELARLEQERDEAREAFVSRRHRYLRRQRKHGSDC